MPGPLSENMWEAYGYLVDPGKHAGLLARDETPPHLIVAAVSSIFGLTWVAMLIGLIIEQMATWMQSIRRKNMRLSVSDHILVLGWSEKTLHLLGELAQMLEDGAEHGGTIVVLGALDPFEMREQVISTYAKGRWPTVHFKYWQGHPHEVDDLMRVQVDRAKVIIVLGTSPTPREHDSLVFTTLCSLQCLPRESVARAEKAQQRIVADVMISQNAPIAEQLGGDSARAITAKMTVDKLIATAMLNSTEARAFVELMSFEGSQLEFVSAERMHDAAERANVPLTFGLARQCFPHGVVLGVRHDDGDEEETMFGGHEKHMRRAEGLRNWAANLKKRRWTLGPSRESAVEAEPDADEGELTVVEKVKEGVEGVVRGGVDAVREGVGGLLERVASSGSDLGSENQRPAFGGGGPSGDDLATSPGTNRTSLSQVTSLDALRLTLAPQDSLKIERTDSLLVIADSFKDANKIVPPGGGALTSWFSAATNFVRAEQSYEAARQVSTKSKSPSGRRRRIFERAGSRISTLFATIRSRDSARSAASALASGGIASLAEVSSGAVASPEPSLNVPRCWPPPSSYRPRSPDEDGYQASQFQDAFQPPMTIIIIGWPYGIDSLLRAIDRRLPPGSTIHILSERGLKWRRGMLATEGISMSGESVDADTPSSDAGAPSPARGGNMRAPLGGYMTSRRSSMPRESCPRTRPPASMTTWRRSRSRSGPPPLRRLAPLLQTPQKQRAKPPADPPPTEAGFRT